MKTGRWVSYCAPCLNRADSKYLSSIAAEMKGQVLHSFRDLVQGMNFIDILHAQEQTGEGPPVLETALIIE